LFVCLGTTLLCVITQRGVVISYRRFGTTHRSHLQSSSIFSLTLRTEPVSCPEMLVINYHFYLRNNPKQLNSQILRGGNLKSRMFTCLFIYLIIHSFTTACPENIRMVHYKIRFFHSDLPFLLFIIFWEKLFCSMLSSHGYKCDEYCHLKDSTILFSKNVTVFLRNILLLSPVYKLFPEDEGRIFLQNFGTS
jgi:hypothetical protein